MNADAHIGEAAELYAAGVLTTEESAAVEAHIARCPDCLRRVGEAEETVLELERVNVAPSAAARGSSLLPFERRGVASRWLAVAAAAAFIIGFILPHGAMQPNLATLAMVRSHFAHAQFSGAGPPAKVIYARDRSWYYIVIAGNYRYEVYGLRNGQATDLGTTQPKSQTSELFSPSSTPFDRVELRAAGKLLEAAAIR
ncbi:MAG TPA: zf-HC2 domain-containing protein [Candidatus Cybelea sp.]|nr:zf-HC2 domain-containing protein [Candidatus Cybelea sp.]